jgi:hypothetical protein
MPFEDIEPEYTGLAPYTPPEKPKEAPGFGATSMAFLRRENIIGSTLSMYLRGGMDQRTLDPNFNPFEKVKGTKYERRVKDFAYDGSEADVAKTMARIDAEERDNEIVDQSGAVAGTLYGIAAGVVDPTILLPGGGVVKAARGGYSIARSAASVAVAGAAGAAVQEGVLQATQLTRTAEEGFVNVAGGAILGGILGGGAGAFMRSAERRLATQLLEQDRAEISKGIGQAAPDAPPVDLPGGLKAIDKEAAVDGEVSRALPTDAQGSVGAAVNTSNLDNRSLNLKGYVLDKIPGVAAVVAYTSPTLRTFTQPIMEARRVMADLAESSLVFVENAAGVPTATRGGPVDRLARNYINQARMAVEPELDALWMQHRFGSAEAGYLKVQGAKLAADVQQLMTSQEEGKLTFDAFKREVGRAMRRGDENVLPEVAQAAELIREKVFEPWKKRILADEKLRQAFGWPENVDTRTAGSYFSRVYNQEALRQRKIEVADQFYRYLDKEQSDKQVIRERVRVLNDDLQKAAATLAKISARDERLEARLQQLETRLDERGREVQRTIARTEDLVRRGVELDEEATDLQVFVDEMQGIVSDPETKRLLGEMQADLQRLRSADRTMTLADLEAADVAERAAALAGPMRRVANIMTGREKEKAPPSMLAWMAKNGGIADPNGEIRAALGGEKIPGLVNQRGRDLDDWGEKLADELSRRGPGGQFQRYEPDEVTEMVRQALAGREPDDWINHLGARDQDRLEAYKIVAVVEDMFDRLGVPSDAYKTPRDVADILAGQRSVGQSYEAMDRELAEMEAAGAAVPPVAERFAKAREIAYTREDIAKARAMIAEARRERGTVEKAAARTGTKEGEARLAENANLGRYGVIDSQIGRAETKAEILRAVRANAETVHDRIRKDMEEQVQQWRGKSSVEAIRAIEAAAKADAERQAKIDAGFMYGQLYKGDGKRLTSADRAVDSAVRHILDKDVFLEPEALRRRANEIVDRLISSPEGRLPYDVASPTFGKALPQGEVRGALNQRDFMIPDEMLDTIPDGQGGTFSVLEDDVEAVMGSYLNTVATDVLLTEKFGDVRMTEAFRRINDETNEKIAAAKTQKERATIQRQAERAKADITAVRDRIRGLYALPSDTQGRNIARIAAAVKNYNVITDLGGATLNSLGEIATPIFRFGFQRVFGDAYGHLLRSIGNEAGAYRQAQKQLKRLGIVSEIQLNSRVHSLGDIVEPYRSGTMLERGLYSAANASQVLNLNAGFTDHNRSIAGMLAMDEVLRASRAVAEGKATKKQVEALAASSIDENGARAIWAEWSNGGGERVDGVYLPNTADWTNRQARELFEGAVAREVDIAVVNPGQEKPLWLSRPALSMLGQFRTFTAAANERILIAQLQQADAKTLSGLVSIVAGGMVSYVAYSAATGQWDKLEKASPNDFLREGISRSGVLGWFEELNTNLSKVSGNRIDAYRLMGSEKPLSKYSSRSPFGQLLGPTAGKIENILTATNRLSAGEWSAADTGRIRRLAPFQNLIGLRLLLDKIEASVNEVLGVPARAVR